MSTINDEIKAELEAIQKDNNEVEASNPNEQLTVEICKALNELAQVVNMLDARLTKLEEHL